MPGPAAVGKEGAHPAVVQGDVGVQRATAFGPAPLPQQGDHLGADPPTLPGIGHEEGDIADAVPVGTAEVGQGHQVLAVEHPDRLTNAAVEDPAQQVLDLRPDAEVTPPQGPLGAVEMQLRLHDVVLGTLHNSARRLGPCKIAFEQPGSVYVLYALYARQKSAFLAANSPS